MRIREIDKEYRCCLCFHVKTGSILLGLWQVIIHVAVMGVLTALVTHPELFNHQNKKRLETSVNVVALGQKDAIVFNDHKIADGLTIYRNIPSDDKDSKKQPVIITASLKETDVNKEQFISGSLLSDQTDRTHESHSANKNSHHWRREDRYVGMALTFLSLIFSGFLLYGAIKERPSYLMPYFCLQVFDFVISCLSIVGYFSYLPDVKVWLRAQHDMPYKQQLLRLDQATLTFTAMTLCLLVLVIKAYLLGMVWTCYKYFVRKQMGQILRNGSSQGMFESGNANRFLFGGFYDDGELGMIGTRVPTEEEGVALGMLPPKYDDVLKTAVNAHAPPPYFTGRILVEATPHLAANSGESQSSS